MTSPRPALRAAVSTAVTLLVVAMLTGCTSQASQEVVAPIVLTEPTPGDGDPGPATGAEPVEPPGPEPAGDDIARRERDAAPGGTSGGGPAPVDGNDEDADDEDAHVPAPDPESNDGDDLEEADEDDDPEDDPDDDADEADEDDDD